MATEFTTITLLGAFGGLLHALFVNYGGLILPRFEKEDEEGRRHLQMGFLADVLLGAGAALGILYFVLPEEFVKQVGLSLVSGFGGGAFLGSLSGRMTTDVERGKVEALAGIVEDKLIKQ